MKLLNFLRTPAAFIAANWTGLAIMLTGIGLIPALAGNARAMSDIREYGDESGRVVLNQFLRTWRREIPVSVGTWVVIAAAIGTVWMAVAVFGVKERVFLISLVAPVYYVVWTFVAAYVRAAAVEELDTPREKLLLRAVELMATQPTRAALQVPLVLLLTPVWVLAPFTLACGLSLPAWLAGCLWGGAHRADPPAVNTDSVTPHMIGADH